MPFDHRADCGSVDCLTQPVAGRQSAAAIVRCRSNSRILGSPTTRRTWFAGTPTSLPAESQSPGLPGSHRRRIGPRLRTHRLAVPVCDNGLIHLRIRRGIATAVRAHHRATHRPQRGTEPSLTHHNEASHVSSAASSRHAGFRAGRPAVAGSHSFIAASFIRTVISA
jgi:hypothetical protein